MTRRQTMHMHIMDVTGSTILGVVLGLTTLLVPSAPDGVNGAALQITATLIGSVLSLLVTHFLRKWLEKKTRKRRKKRAAKPQTEAGTEEVPDRKTRTATTRKN